MNRARDQFFAGARFAANQDSRAGASYFQNHLLHRFHFRRSGDDLDIDLIEISEFAFDRPQQDVAIERLLQIVDRAAARSTICKSLSIATSCWGRSNANSEISIKSMSRSNPLRRKWKP